MPNNGYSAPCVTSQPSPWDDDDSLYEMAEKAWSDCWPDEPPKQVSKFKQRTLDHHWLLKAFANIVEDYDGPLSDIADHIGEFSDRFIEKRVRAILEDAREAEAQAQADAAADARADSREDW